MFLNENIFYTLSLLMAEMPALRSFLIPIKCDFTHVKKGNKRGFTHYIRYL